MLKHPIRPNTIAVIAIVLLSACQQAQTSTPSTAVSLSTKSIESARPTSNTAASTAPFATEVPTPSPGVEAQLAFNPPAGVLPWGSVVVANEELQLHQYPARSSTPTLTTAVGDRLIVTGPLIVGDERWYRLRLVDNPTGSGYVALDPTADDISVEPVVCPDLDATSATVTGVTSLTAWERLSCFGDREMTLDGYEIVGFGGFRPGTFEPEWLNGYLGTFAIVDPDDVAYANPLFVRVEPGVDVTRPPVAGDVLVGTALLRVAGHLNHSASTQCTATDIPITDDLEGPTADYAPIAAEIACRQVFVVTGFEVIGQ